MAARAAACATVPGPDIRQQLATLLGKETVGPIHKTDEAPPTISVVDTIAAITRKNANHSAEVIRDLSNRYPEVNDNIVNFKFPGRGQRNTAVTGVRGIVEITMPLQGHRAATVQCAARPSSEKWLVIEMPTHRDDSVQFTHAVPTSAAKAAPKETVIKFQIDDPAFANGSICLSIRPPDKGGLLEGSAAHAR